MLSRILITLVMCIASFTLASSVKKSELTIAFDHWPPLMTTKLDSGGFAGELTTKLLTKIGITSKIKSTNFDAALAGLKKGDYDVMPAIWWRAERTADVAFSDPYFRSRIEVVSYKQGSITSIKELAGKKVSMVESFNYQKKFPDFLKSELYQTQTPVENFENLLNGKVDYAIMDSTVLRFMVKKYSKELKGPIHKNFYLSSETLHIGISKKITNYEEIRMSLNDELQKMKLSGELEFLLLKHSGPGATY